MTVSTTLTKPDATTKLNGMFRVCEAQDEELTAISALIELDSTDSDNGEESALYIHCLFRKEIFSLYALIRVSIEPSELVLTRAAMFGFPVYASRLVSDPLSQLIVAYDDGRTFEAECSNMMEN